MGFGGGRRGGGFGGGRSGGFGGGHRSGGFGGGRRVGGHRPSFHHHHHHHHRPYRHYGFILRPRWFVYGPAYYTGSYGSFLIGRVFALIMLALISFGCIFGGLKITQNYLSYDSVYCQIIDCEEKTDYYGDYYEYDLTYEYKGNTYTNKWEDDYYTDLGTYKLYVKSDNPLYIRFTKPSIGGAVVLFIFGTPFALFTLAAFISLFRRDNSSPSNDNNSNNTNNANNSSEEQFNYLD